MQPVPPALILAFAVTGALAACVLPGQPHVPSGRQDFESLCSSCHGVDGSGTGEMADLLDRKPADLTQLAAANGGVFPTGKVMAKIWGYARPGGASGAVMPEFGPLLEGNTVLFDAGDGIDTPTPLRLVQIAQYVETLQP